MVYIQHYQQAIKFTNFDANPLSNFVCLYRSTQTTSAINLLQPEEEQSTKEKRCNIWEELDSHNDVTVAAARTGKRDHSSMVATPIFPNPKRLGAGMKGNIKRWTQQEITPQINWVRNKTIRKKAMSLFKTQILQVVQVNNKGGITIEDHKSNRSQERQLI